MKKETEIKLFFQAVGSFRHMGKPESSSCHYDISKQTEISSLHAPCLG